MPEAEAAPDDRVAYPGLQLDDRAGTQVGRIEGALIDDATNSVEWLLVRFGRFGQRALVPARDAVGAVGRVWVPFDAEQIRTSPKASAGKELSREDELALLVHYGIDGPVGRAADLADRDGSGPTSRPA